MILLSKSQTRAAHSWFDQGRVAEFFSKLAYVMGGCIFFATAVSSHVFQTLLVKILFCDFSTSSTYKLLALQNVMISLDLFWTRYAVMFLLQSSIQIWTNNSQKQTMPCNLPSYKKPALNCSMKNIENSTAGFHIFSRD